MTKMILEGLLIAIAFIAFWREDIITGIKVVAKAITSKNKVNEMKEERA